MREPSTADPGAPPPVNKLGGWKLLAVWLLALLLRAWNSTLRFTYEPGDREAASNTEQPMIIVLWHNRILVTSEIKRRCRMARPTSGMVSASKDGALLAAFFHAVGIRAVRGSSSKRSIAAARELLGELKAGRDIAITPDGPRGPIYSFQEGASMLALLSGARLLLLAPNFGSAWRINSWDGLYIPKPFSRLHVRGRLVEPEELPRERLACSAWIRNALLEMTRDQPPPPRALASAPKRGSSTPAT